ncbi:hypothetical protein RNS50_11645, partial [Staphylococcus pseudintermedius]|uniref:hypothetical protein n=1 Tax=Staphylococcus pseudintermedius TaxID=283734 RepID=UPI002887F5B7
ASALLPSIKEREVNNITNANINIPIFLFIKTTLISILYKYSIIIRQKNYFLSIFLPIKPIKAHIENKTKILIKFIA